MPSLSFVVAGLLLVVLLCALYGVFLGYPPPRFSAKVLNTKEQAVAAACAITLFPARDPMPLDGIEAGIVEYLDLHLSELPRDKRFQVRLLLAFIEHSPWLFHVRRRFTALSPEKRLEILTRMSMSRIYFRRLCFLSLRTLCCMAYFSNPIIAARVGCTPSTRPFEQEVGA